MRENMIQTTTISLTSLMRKNKETQTETDGTEKSTKKVETKEQVFHRTIKAYKENVNMNISEEDREAAKSKYEAKIRRKLEAGKPLTSKEKAYLKENNKDLYLQVMRIEAKRKALEESLKHCKSKEEAQDAMDIAMSSISKDDPVKEYMISAVQYTMNAFKETDSYKKLPATREEANQRDNHGNNKIKTDKRAKEEQEESDCADSVSFEGGFGSYQQAFTGNIPSAAFVSEG